MGDFIVTGYDSVTGEPVSLALPDLFVAGRPVLMAVYEGNLNSGNQDTNDASRTYTWTTGGLIAGEGLSISGNTRFVADEAISIQVCAKLEVTNATANDRASFATTLVVRDSSGAVARTYGFPSVYIRDDNANYDKGLAAGTASMSLAVGESVELQSRRLSSQDPNDDNPADPARSTMRIEKWELA